MDAKICMSNERAVTLPVAESLLPTTGQTALTIMQLRYVVQLLAGVAESTERALRDRNPKLFDGNPGDFGCQRQALNIYELTPRVALLEECVEFKAEASQLANRMNVATNGRVKASAAELRQMMTALRMPSRDLTYLLLCRLLATVRTKSRVLNTGVIMTVSDPNLLSRLCKRMDKVPYVYRECIVTESQSRVSAIALTMLQEQAERMSSLAEERKRFVCARLATAESVLYTRLLKHLPKTFICLYYDMVTVLRRASELRALVCVKSVEIGDTPRCGYLFQAAQAGGALDPVPADRLLDELEPVIVIEAVITGDRVEAVNRIASLGLETVVLRDASLAPQLQNGSKVDDLPNEEAQKEIKRRMICATIEPGPLAIDHIYTSTLKVENVRRITQ